MNIREIERLLDLAKQAKSRDLAIFVRALAEYDRLVKKIEEIEIEKRHHVRSACNDFQAIALWQRWANVEIGNLQYAKARVEASKEECRQNALQASGRVQALEAMLKKAGKALILTNRKRAEQNGFQPDA